MQRVFDAYYIFYITSSAFMAIADDAIRVTDSTFCVIS